MNCGRSVLGSLLSLGAMLSFLAACGQTPSVDLKNPQLKGPDFSKNPPSKPGRGVFDTDDGNGGGSGNETSGPIIARGTPVYRFVCQNSITSWMTSFTSRANGSDHPLYLSANEASTTTSEAGDNGPSIMRFEGIVALKTEGASGLKVLHASVTSRVAAYRGLYLTTEDLLYRNGRATLLAVEVTPLAAAEMRAGDLGLKLRAHGAAVSGDAIIIPDGKALKVLDLESLKTLQTLALDPLVTFFPSLDENSGVLSVLRFDTKTNVFKPAFFLSTESKSVPVQFKVDTTPQAGFTAAGPVIARGARYYWVEVPTQLTKAPRELVIAWFDTASLKIERVHYSAPAGYAVAPRAAFLEGTSGDSVVLALENIQSTPATDISQARAKVTDAKLVIHQIESATLTAKAELTYPLEVVSVIEAVGLEARPIAVRSLFASPDGRELFVELPGRLEPFLYQARSGSLERLTDGGCVNASVVKVSEP